jgi:uncharacterized membrane protein
MTLDDQAEVRGRAPAGEKPDIVDVGLERLLALSDGVFAIAITVMVFQLTVPEITPDRVHDELAGRLWSMWPKVGSYALAFLFVGSYWIAHRRIFRWIERGDGTLALLNILLLLCVAFQPFPTAVLAAYGKEAPAVMFFAATLALTGIVVLLLWLYAVSGNRLISHRGHRPMRLRHHTLPTALTPAVFLLSIAIAPFSPFAAKLSWVLIIVIPIGLAVYFRSKGRHELADSIVNRW